MKKIIVPVILLFVFSFSLMAAKYDFRVIAVKGNAEYFTGNGDWKHLKPGTMIFSNYQIKLDQKSYLGIIHNSGKTLELKDKGKWTTKELLSKLNKKSTNVAANLSDYVVGQLNEKMNEDYNYREGMETTGAVERSLNFGSGAGSTTFVQLNTPRKINFTTNSATFVWQNVNSEEKYVFTITDRFDRIVHSKIVTDNQYKIDAKDLNLQPDEYYFWNVACNNDRTIKSPDCAFSFLSPSSVSKIENEFTELKNELGDENSALNQIVFANFYEKNYLFDKALQHYKKAVELEPSVEQYQIIYSEFLKRSNF